MSADRRYFADMAWHERQELQPAFAPQRLRDYLARAPKTMSSLKLANRIAFIGGAQLGGDLEHFAKIERVLPGADVRDADILLIAGDWPRAGEPWREALLNLPQQARELRELIARCRTRGIPSVLWLTGEADTVAAMIHLKDSVDEIFVPEGTRVEGARQLDIGVNVKLFNPFVEDLASARADEPFFRFAVDGAHELSQFLESDAVLRMVAPLLKYDSWLIDSAYHYQVPDLKLPAALRRRFLGHLSPQARAALQKLAYGLFLPDILHAKRPVYFRARGREAAACKTLVFGETPSGHDNVTPMGDQPGSFLSALLADDVGRMAIAHKAWRDVLSQHTLFERLETIFASVNVKTVYQGSARPGVNVVMPTIRPHLIPLALTMFARQTWPQAQMTIVVNGGGIPEDVRRLVHETPNVRLCTVPEDKTLGYCMNYGIDQVDAEYWAKWDDDDVYGPHYLEDQMLQRKYVDFDIAGKAAIFTYIEGHDCIYLRSYNTWDSFASHLGGGTFLVRNGDRHFAEDGRGAEDRAFLFLARERGDRIVAGDPFNFLQVRRQDIASHTWTVGAHVQDLRGPRRAGFDLGNIIL